MRSNSIVEREPVSHGQFELDHVPVGSFSVRLVTAPGEAPLLEEYHQFEPGGAPLVLELPERAGNKPISGLVSLRDLQHPIPRKPFAKLTKRSNSRATTTFRKPSPSWKTRSVSTPIFATPT